MDKINIILERLIKEHSLTEAEYKFLIENRTEEIREKLAKAAESAKRSVYGDKIFIRGLIEISNICKNDCLYCGIRKSNRDCERYRLSKEEILSCCENGFNLGFRTFVLQGGEDGYFSDERLIEIIQEIKKRYPECAITLSLGERTKESYKALKAAGADRYLLRHETAQEMHYNLLHPKELSFKNRIKCLRDLKEIGYQVGCGFMVGSPYQTAESLAKDFKFIEEFSPEMCGIGPFIPSDNTPFEKFPQGSLELTLFCLAVVRLIKPNILLPATTALNTISEDGRLQGIKHGANVIMPNLSPSSAKEKYMLYNGKANINLEAAAGIEKLKEIILSIGHRISMDRGDIVKEK